MGWNDRLPEDPYIPYADDADRQSYEEWHQYLLECQREEINGLTSANLQPGDIDELMARVRINRSVPPERTVAPAEEACPPQPALQLHQPAAPAAAGPELPPSPDPASGQ
jgi:hypothetical protein